MNKEVKSLHGNIEVITLAEFLQRVQRSTFDKNIYQFNCQISHSHVLATSFDPKEEVSTYERKALYLLKGNEQEIAKSGIMAQVRFKRVFKRSIQETIEDATVDSLLEFGSPELLVKLAPRMYLLANMDNYKLIQNGDYVVLACTNTTADKIYQIDRTTEAEFLKKAKKFSPGTGMTDEDILERVRKGI